MKTRTMKQTELTESYEIIVFGLGPFSSLMTRYIELFTNWEIAAYTADDDFCSAASFLDKKVIPLSELESCCPPDKFKALLAVGYTKKGEVRRHAFAELKRYGYRLCNFIHPESIVYADELGEGNIVLEGAILGIGTQVGNANLFWNGINLSHECSVGSFNTFCPSASFGGCCEIGDNCFFGVGSSCRDHLHIASFSLLGAGSYLNHDAEPGSYNVGARPNA